MAQEPASASTLSVAPDFCAMICWVRLATRTALSVGRAGAASMMLRCGVGVPNTGHSARFPSAASFPAPLHPWVYRGPFNPPGKRSILFRGTYGVHPPERLHLWSSPAFEPAIRGGNIYARGTADDKG